LKNQNLENLPEIKKVLLKCLKEGGNIIRRGYGRTHSIHLKGPVSIVTEIDTATEKKIVSIIKNRFPSHRLLTEESSPYKGTSSYRWIIDPLDGTTNYAHHLPLFCVSIGLENEGKIILGGIYNPISDELFFAEKGRGAFLNGKKIKVSQTKRLIESLLVTGFPYDRQEKAVFYLKFFKEMMQRTQGLRRLGAAAMDLAYVACGRFEAFWEFNLKPWDMAAGSLIVEEAGGKITDFEGNPINIDKPFQLLSSNSKVHHEITSIFKKILKNLPNKH
jgi:myo-inositol-1(or 4)-monophosphatase